MNLVFNIRLCIYPQIRFPTMSSPEFFAGTEQVDDKYSGGFPLRQEAEYGVAQFFDGKLDVGFG